MSTVPAGYVDSIQDAGGRFDVQGWALDDRNEPPACVLVLVDGRSVATSGFCQFERPDVTAHLGLPHGVSAGFSIRAHARPVPRAIRVVAVFRSGQVAEIPGGDYSDALTPVPETAPASKSAASDEPGFQQKFSVPIVAYPDDSLYAGLYSTAALYNRRPRGVTGQFLEDAGTYHRKYTAHGYWRTLLSNALSRAAVDARSVRSILDIGSGSGNSVLPILDMLPGSEVISTDISPQLLAILRRQLAPEQLERCHLVVADASDRCLAPESFDLVIGAAVLHHLFDPAEAMGACAAGLRPGGTAVFFEPFEAGNAVLRSLYEQLVDRKKELRLSTEVVGMLENIARDVSVRTGSDKSDPIFETLDDKWLFTRHYFKAQRERFGFSKLEIYPLGNLEEAFTRQLLTHLRLCLDKPAEALSPAAWNVVRRYDRLFSDELKPDLLLEGCILLTK